MAKKEHIWWAWQDPNGELDLENLRPTRPRCDCRSNPWGDRAGKPVRVRITPIAGKGTKKIKPCKESSLVAFGMAKLKKKGTVKRGK